MAKRSQLEQAIASLEADRAVLDLAIQRLKVQQQQREAKPVRMRKPKLVAGGERIS